MKVNKVSHYLAAPGACFGDTFVVVSNFKGDFDLDLDNDRE